MVNEGAYREVFFAYNSPGPYTCFHCSEEVSFDDVLVHHLDHDEANNDVANLVPSHDFCHKSHHHKGKQHTDEARAKMSSSHRGLKASAKTRRKMRQSQRRRRRQDRP